MLSVHASVFDHVMAEALRGQSSSANASVLLKWLGIVSPRRYADCCLQTALRLGMPRLPHPSATRLGPGERLRIAYVSSDFGNHPLSHLMASVFGGHDRSRLEVRRHAGCVFGG